MADSRPAPPGSSPPGWPAPPRRGVDAGARNASRPGHAPVHRRLRRTGHCRGHGNTEINFSEAGVDPV